MLKFRFKKLNQPELDAVLVAKNIAEQLVKRGSFKKAMKRAAISAMKSGAKGIKVCCSGRLNGAEIAREEWTRVDLFLCILLDQMLIMALRKHLLRMGRLVLRFGFVKANISRQYIGRMQSC